MKKIFLFSLIFVLCGLFGPAACSGQTLPWRVGEDLVYKVRWSFVRLGTLSIRIADSSMVRGEPVYHAELQIDSNPLLFFVNRHYRYFCSFSSSFKVQKLLYYDDEEGAGFTAEYTFDHQKKQVRVVRSDTAGTAGTLVKDLSFSGELYDGFSLIYYARATAHRVRRDTVQYIADDGIAPMIIDFLGRDVPVRTPALSRKTPALAIGGFVFDEGIAGLTGEFRGWFSDDGRRLPLKAALKVFIGSVLVELETVRYTPPEPGISCPTGC